MELLFPWMMCAFTWTCNHTLPGLWHCLAWTATIVPHLRITMYGEIIHSPYLEKKWSVADATIFLFVCLLSKIGVYHCNSKGVSPTGWQGCDSGTSWRYGSGWTWRHYLLTLSGLQNKSISRKIPDQIIDRHPSKTPGLIYFRANSRIVNDTQAKRLGLKVNLYLTAL